MIKNISQSKLFKGILIGIGILVVLLVVFQAGRFVGFRQASFSFRLGDNYYRAFEGRRLNDGPGAFDFNLPGGHGAAGRIVRISLPTLVVAGPNNVEKVVRVSNDTIVRQFRGAIKPEVLKIGDSVVVLGSPNDQAEIVAQLIRLMPPMGMVGGFGLATSTSR